MSTFSWSMSSWGIPMDTAEFVAQVADDQQRGYHNWESSPLDSNPLGVFAFVLEISNSFMAMNG